MTFYDKLWGIASTANGAAFGILSESMKESVRPYIIKEMNELAREIKYDGWTYDQSYEQYPIAMYQMMWHPVRKAVLKFLQEKHPQAWFLPMYLTVEEQRAMGFPV